MSSLLRSFAVRRWRAINLRRLHARHPDLERLQPDDGEGHGGSAEVYGRRVQLHPRGLAGDLQVPGGRTAASGTASSGTPPAIKSLGTSWLHQLCC